MDTEILIKILAGLSLPSTVGSVYLYFENKKFKKWDAEKELAKRENLIERLQVEHEQERQELVATCAGERRRRGAIITDTFTVDDEAKIASLAVRQRTILRDAYAERTYFENILEGRSVRIIGRNSSWWFKLKRRFLG